MKSDAACAPRVRKSVALFGWLLGEQLTTWVRRRSVRWISQDFRRSSLADAR